MDSLLFKIYEGLPRWYSGKESTCQCRRPKTWMSGKWQSTPIFLPGKSHRQRSLACDHKELDMTEHTHMKYMSFPGGSVVKNPHANARDSIQFCSWVGKIPWRKWLPTPIFLPRNSHGQRSLAGYSPWSHRRVGHNLLT